MRLLEAGEPPARAVVLVQREVAARLAAGPGDWSLATVAIRSLADVERIRDVPPSAFDPPPAVHSSIIRITPSAKAEPSTRASMLALARPLFQSRRKTLRNGVSRALGGDLAGAGVALADAGIDPGRRPGTLRLDEWELLARAVADVRMVDAMRQPITSARIEPDEDGVVAPLHAARPAIAGAFRAAPGIRRRPAPPRFPLPLGRPAGVAAGRQVPDVHPARLHVHADPASVAAVGADDRVHAAERPAQRSGRRLRGSARQTGAHGRDQRRARRAHPVDPARAVDPGAARSGVAADRDHPAVQLGGADLRPCRGGEHSHARAPAADHRGDVTFHDHGDPHAGARRSRRDHRDRLLRQPGAFLHRHGAVRARGALGLEGERQPARRKGQPADRQRTFFASCATASTSFAGARRCGSASTSSRSRSWSSSPSSRSVPCISWRCSTARTTRPTSSSSRRCSG